MIVRGGTSGWSYKEWKGTFYPEELKNDGFLGYYGTKLPTVEVNNTFYRMPRQSVVEAWCEKVPTDFRFVVKASMRITHRQKLADADESVAYFLKVTAGFGDKLGAVLFQLPPTFRKDVERLDSFLGLLGERCKPALEFRHPSWFDDDVYAVLTKHNAAFCGGEAEGKLAAPPLVVTGDWGFLRLRGEDYTEADIDAWADRVRAQPWKEAYVFFKHEELGPMLAGQFNQRFCAADAPGPGIAKSEAPNDEPLAGTN